MRKLILLSALTAVLLSTGANAQAPQEINLTLTAQDLNTIAAGLQELPAKIANPLWQKINNQVEVAAKTAARTPKDAEIKK